jgi:hypothetical protein
VRTQTAPCYSEPACKDGIQVRPEAYAATAKHRRSTSLSHRADELQERQQAHHIRVAKRERRSLRVENSCCFYSARRACADHLDSTASVTAKPCTGTCPVSVAPATRTHTEHELECRTAPQHRDSRDVLWRLGLTPVDLAGRTAAYDLAQLDPVALGRSRCACADCRRRARPLPACASSQKRLAC